jgi:pimeloyl-ACP methyl ester carboxylesterase
VTSLVSIPLPDGLELDVSLDGSKTGEKVLLLHGFPETRRGFERLQSGLAQEGFEVAAPDQRGYSPRARPLDVSAYRLELLVLDVLRVLDALQWPRVHLVGHDFGALVGWAFASKAPERVRSFTALAVAHPAALAAALEHDADQQKRSRYVRLFRLPGGVAERILLGKEAEGLRRLYHPFGDPVLLEAYVARFQEPGALTAALAWYRANESVDLFAVGRCPVPTTLVWGNQDPAEGRTAAEGTAAQVTGPYTFVELDGAGHFLLQERSDDVFRAALAQFRKAPG